MEMDENVRYEKIKKALKEWEISIIFDFYEGFQIFIEKDYCVDKLKETRSNDEKIMAYMQLLTIYVSIYFAKLRRQIEENLIDYDHGLFEKLILPLISEDKTKNPSKQDSETYSF